MSNDALTRFRQGRQRARLDTVIVRKPKKPQPYTQPAPPPSKSPSEMTQDDREMKEFWAWANKAEEKGWPMPPLPWTKDTDWAAYEPPLIPRKLLELRRKDREEAIGAKARETNERRGNRYPAVAKRSVTLDQASPRVCLIARRWSYANLVVTGCGSVTAGRSRKKVPVVELDIMGLSGRLASVGITCDGTMELPAHAEQLRLDLVDRPAATVRVAVVEGEPRADSGVQAPEEWIVRRLVKGRKDNRKPRGGR